MKSHLINKKKGFTIIEALIAVFILVVAIVGPLSLSSRGLQSARIARDQVTGSYLAQEGIDYIRYLRDNGALEMLGNLTLNDLSAKWQEWLGSCFVGTGTGGCNIDPSKSKENGGICDLNTDDGCSDIIKPQDESFFRYGPMSDATSKTPFKREIRVKSVAGRDDEVVVESRVYWSTGSYAGSVVLTEHMFNIYSE